LRGRAILSHNIFEFFQNIFFRKFSIFLHFRLTSSVLCGVVLNPFNVDLWLTGNYDWVRLVWDDIVIKSTIFENFSKSRKILKNFQKNKNFPKKYNIFGKLAKNINFLKNLQKI